MCELTFNQITLNPVNHENQIWIRSSDLALALGYKDPKAISKIYAKFSDEFSNDMSVVLNLGTTDNTPCMTRVFSLRGCHLLAMFARTPVAKDFRKWVLDVLDRMAESEPEENPNTILPEKPVNAITNGHKTVLQTIVNTRTHNLPKEIKYTAKGEMWGKLHRFFQLPNIAYLQDAHFDRACKYLMEMELDCVAEHKALPGNEVADRPALPEGHFPDVPHFGNSAEALAKLEDMTKTLGGLYHSINFGMRPGGLSMNSPAGDMNIWHGINNLVLGAIHGLDMVTHNIKTICLLGAGRKFL